MNPRRRRVNRLHRKQRKAREFLAEIVKSRAKLGKLTFYSCTCGILPYCVPHAIGAGLP